MAEKLRISPRSYIDLERGKYGFSAATFAFFLLILSEEDVLELLRSLRKLINEEDSHDAA